MAISPENPETAEPSETPPEATPAQATPAAPQPQAKPKPKRRRPRGGEDGGETTEGRKKRRGVSVSPLVRALAAGEPEPEPDPAICHALTPGLSPILDRIVAEARAQQAAEAANGSQDAQGDATDTGKAVTADTNATPPARRLRPCDRPPDGRDLEGMETHARVALERYLRALMEGCHEVDAWRRAGLNWPRISGYLRDFPTLRAVHHTVRDSKDFILKELRLRAGHERAVNGWDEPVFWQGMKVGQVRKYDGRLLIRLIEGDDPARFGRQVEHSGTVEVRDGLARLLDEIADRGRFDPPSDRPHTRPIRNLRTIEVAQSVDVQEDSDE